MQHNFFYFHVAVYLGASDILSAFGSRRIDEICLTSQIRVAGISLVSGVCL